MIRSLKRLYHSIVAIASLCWFGFPARQLTVIGVTGTDGKTTTTTLIYEMLRAAKHKTSMISSIHAVIAGKSYDTGLHVTTPNAFWIQRYLRDAVNHGDTHVVLEVTSHALDQFRVLGIPFAVGILTNISHEHLDWHKTFDEYLRAKLSLLKSSRIVILNRDDAQSYGKLSTHLQSKTLITYGIRRDAKVTPKVFPFSTTLPGEFNRYNCLAAIAAALSLGVSDAIIRDTVRKFRSVSGRMEYVVKKPFPVIVDFAHTPNAIDNVLKTLRKKTKKRLIHVFGSAGLRDVSKRRLMGNASSRYADVIVLTEEDYRTEDVNTIIDTIASGIGENRIVYKKPDRGQAIAFVLKLAGPGDFVVITGKGHEKSICRGTTEYPWSDQEEVRRVFKLHK